MKTSSRPQTQAQTQAQNVQISDRDMIEELLTAPPEEWYEMPEYHREKLIHIVWYFAYNNRNRGGQPPIVNYPDKRYRRYLHKLYAKLMYKRRIKKGDFRPNAVVNNEEARKARS